MSLRNRIIDILPTNSSGRDLTRGQVLRALNRSVTNAPVADATVRGRLSELVRDGVVATLTRPSGLTGFYCTNG